MRRVVITGMGLVTPLGVGVSPVWSRLINGESGIRSVTSCDVSDLPSKVAGEVPGGPLTEHCFDPDEVMLPNEQRKVERFILMALTAAKQAIEDADWLPNGEEDCARTGVLIGAGIGGLQGIYENSTTLLEKGARRVSPFFVPSSLINLASGQIAIKYGFTGPVHAVVTACASGSHALGDAARIIACGDADVMVAGGAESTICRIGIAGFAALRALSTRYNHRPAEASRPWDRDRDGFVMGEGAGVLVLEEYEHARARGAFIHAELKGYGLSGDAYHVTAPVDSGSGAVRCMQMALRRAQLCPDDIDYINAHGTSTPLGDMVELRAVKQVFGDHAHSLTMSSTKSAIGHLLGASGAVEAVFCIQALRDQVVPPTLNLDQPDAECDLDLAPKQAKQRPVHAVLSNSFGFGGMNASLVFTPVQ